MFELTKSYLGIQEQNNMLLAAANLHSKLEKNIDTVVNLSPSQRKRFIKNGMIAQMKELGHSVGFIRKHLVLYRAYQLYEDFYFYFVDEFKQKDASMGDVQLSMLTLANEYLEHEFKNKGYANIFDFLKREGYSKKILDEYTHPNKSSKFNWEDVSRFFDWDGRPAVVAFPASGEVTGWVVRDSDNAGSWTEANPASISASGRPLSSEVFHEVFADYLDINLSNSESHKDSQDNWMDGVDEALESLTQEEWQEAINARYADEVDKYQKMSEPEIMQIDHDFDWDKAYGFCSYKGIPALQFRTKNDPSDKTLTPYTLHARYLNISEGEAHWKEINQIPIGVCAYTKSMLKDDFIKFADDYLNQSA